MTIDSPRTDVGLVYAAIAVRLSHPAEERGAAVCRDRRGLIVWAFCSPGYTPRYIRAHPFAFRRRP